MVFVVELLIGVLVGSGAAGLALHRWRILYPYAVAGALIVAIILASLPMGLETRIGLLAGWMCGFVVGSVDMPMFTEGRSEK
ncbi:MAG TPA: hypothetical protein VFB34_00285 [Chloroflexota bacterium]|nr:hypothetical protein [Chloroflexota bacterium]